MFGVGSLVRGFFSIARSIKGVRFGLVRHLKTAWAHLQAACSIGEWCARRISLVVFQALRQYWPAQGMTTQRTSSQPVVCNSPKRAMMRRRKLRRRHFAAGVQRDRRGISLSFFFLIELSMAYSTQPHIRGVSTGRRAQEHVTVGPTPLAHMDLGARKRSGQGGKCQHS